MSNLQSPVVLQIDQPGEAPRLEPTGRIPPVSAAELRPAPACAAAALRRFLREVQLTGRYDWRRWLEIERSVDDMAADELDLLEHTLVSARRARRDRRAAEAT